MKTPRGVFKNWSIKKVIITPLQLHHIFTVAHYMKRKLKSNTNELAKVSRQAMLCFQSDLDVFIVFYDHNYFIFEYLTTPLGLCDGVYVL